jgi:Xaa-Pro aminopeptidase
MEFAARRTALAHHLTDHSVLLLHAGVAKHRSQDSYFSFEVSRNFFYLTGITQAGTILLLHKKDDANLTATLFIEASDPIKAKWDGAVLTKEEASSISGIEVANIRYLHEYDGVFQSLTVHSRLGVPPINKVYLDLFRLKGNENPDAVQAAQAMQQTYPELTIENANALFATLRNVKSSSEVEAIEHAIAINHKGLEAAWAATSSATSELDLFADYTASLLRQASSESFNTIVASGHNATILHYHENNQPLGDNDLILMDCGAIYQTYNSDITRTWPKNGVFSARQQALYQLVLEVNKACIDMAKPGVTWQELNLFAKDHLAKGLVRLGVMETEAEVGDYYYHSIGHHLGLDVHDAGVYSTPLEAGNVITIEPGIYIAKEKIGIRIEDDILITNTGSKNLSSAIPKEIKEIEAILSKR